MNFGLFATTAKGLEEVLAGEIRRLGLRVDSVHPGGVAFGGDREACYRANLWLRTANRVLVPMARFRASTAEELYRGVRELSWERWIPPDRTFAVVANARATPGLAHSGFVALKAKDAIADAVRAASGGRRPSVAAKDPDVRVDVHLSRGECVVSLDSTGSAGLHQRRYRLEGGCAPLRETLAAGLVELTGWDASGRRGPLFDPMCGSGTIAIEAALKSAGRAPGRLRGGPGGPGFGFQRWPEYDARLWDRLLREADAMAVGGAGSRMCVRGSDSSAEAVRAARENAERAGVWGSGVLEFEQADLFETEPAAGPPGVLVFNPPYGERLGEGERLRDLYRRIGDRLKRRWRGWTAWMLVGNRELIKSVGLRPSRRIVLFNGPIECRLLRFDLY